MTPRKYGDATKVTTPTVREWARMYAAIRRKMPSSLAQKEHGMKMGRANAGRSNGLLQARLNRRLMELGLIEPKRPNRIIEVRCKRTSPKCSFRLIYTQEMVEALEQGKVVTWCCPECRKVNRSVRRNDGAPKNRKGPPTMKDWEEYEEKARRAHALTQGAEGTTLGTSE